ncbi:MAG TPA: serine/threonine-protein kinase, partial [Acetobacteraceae bacterium]|nr:serine/threonine-protein kinase [Acetobacteraceae bacterium]
QFASNEQIEQCLRLQAAEVEVGKGRRSLGDIMVDLGFLSTKQLDQAIAEQRRRLKEMVVGPYHILDKLGQGGMGAVYRAAVPDTGIEVALKLLPKRLSTDPNFLARFRREANIGMEMNHPHIVRTVDFGESKGTYYLAMEIVEGGTLDHHLQVSSTIPERTALKIVRDLLGALQYAHEKGLVHRDIKPSNIIFDREGKSKLSDFGLVKGGEPDPSFMTFGTTVGTPHYMAPEQARGEAIDIRADLYSLGATLYHAVTGRTPFSGSSAAVLMDQHLSKEMPPPEQVNPAITPGCAAIIKKLMAKDRRGRYATPAEALEDVLRHLRGEPALALAMHATPTRAPTPTRPAPVTKPPAAAQAQSAQPQPAQAAAALPPAPAVDQPPLRAPAPAAAAATPQSIVAPRRKMRLLWPILLVISGVVWVVGIAMMISFINNITTPPPRPERPAVLATPAAPTAQPAAPAPERSAPVLDQQPGAAPAGAGRVP